MSKLKYLRLGGVLGQFPVRRVDLGRVIHVLDDVHWRLEVLVQCVRAAARPSLARPLRRDAVRGKQAAPVDAVQIGAGAAYGLREHGM